MSEFAALEEDEVTEAESDGFELAFERKSVQGKLIKAEVRAPKAAAKCPGIELIGHTIRKLVFSTDLYIIRNSNADAVLAAAPFTCQPAITQALLQVSGRPVLVGVTGATTSGARSVILAMEAESQGATAVMANMTASPELIGDMAQVVDIPVVATVGAYDETVDRKVIAGARVVNVAAGRNTAKVVAEIREAYPQLPIIATAGPTEETAEAAIAAGADALSWTPPSCAELERETMRRNREQAGV